MLDYEALLREISIMTCRLSKRIEEAIAQHEGGVLAPDNTGAITALRPVDVVELLAAANGLWALVQYDYFEDEEDQDAYWRLDRILFWAEFGEKDWWEEPIEDHIKTRKREIEAYDAEQAKEVKNYG